MYEMCCIIFWFVINTIVYHLGRYSFPLLPLKSSMTRVTPIKVTLDANQTSLFLMTLASRCRTQIVGQGGLGVTSFIYMYKTSTTYPLYETTQHFVLINKWRSWVQSALPTIRLYPQSGYDHLFDSPSDRFGVVQKPYLGYNRRKSKVLREKALWRGSG